MYRCGDIGLVDRLRAKTLLAEAMEQGCDLAAFACIRDLIFGRSGLKSDPAKAIELLNELIRGQGDNPMWRYMRGWAVQVTGSFPDAKDDYEAAAMEGLSLHGLTWHVLCRSMKKTNWPTRKHFQRRWP